MCFIMEKSWATIFFFFKYFGKTASKVTEHSFVRSHGSLVYSKTKERVIRIVVKTTLKQQKNKTDNKISAGTTQSSQVTINTEKSQAER